MTFQVLLNKKKGGEGRGGRTMLYFTLKGADFLLFFPSRKEERGLEDLNQ